MRLKKRSLFGQYNMLEGSPLAVMIKFSLPLLFGNSAQLLYNTVNAIIVGNLIGSDALASVGVSTPIMNMFFTFFMTVGTGVSTVVAQFYGAKNKEQLSRSIGTSVILTLISTLAITALGIPLSGPILRLMSVDVSVFDWAHQYLLIIFAGAVGVGFFNVLSGVLRGLGNSVFPLIVLIITSFVNIILVYLFVGIFNFGVAGAAWATVTSQTMSAVICMIKLLKMREITSFELKSAKLEKDMVKHILGIGVPSGITQVVLQTTETFVIALVSRIVVLDSTGLANQTIFIAAHTIFNQVHTMSSLPNQALNLGSSTFTGQNIGAGRFDRIKKAYSSLLIASFVVATALMAALWIWGEALLKLFIDMSAPNAALVIEWGVKIQRVMIWCLYGNVLINVPSGVMRGAGDTLPAMAIALFCTVLLRLPMAYIWVGTSVSEANPGGTYHGIYWSMVICTAIAGILSVIYYATGRWKRKIIVNTPCE